ncbi:SNARE associated Golgi protein family [Raphanus sativus]|nr:SNARE associated Golgi protein family [Raphanus sativus]
MSNPLKDPVEDDDASDSVPHLRDDNESVRLVVAAHEASPPETVSLSVETRSRNLLWWCGGLKLCVYAHLHSCSHLFLPNGVFPFYSKKCFLLPLLLKLQERFFPMSLAK